MFQSGKVLSSNSYVKKIALISVFLVSVVLRSMAQEHDTIQVTMNNYTYLVFDSKVVTTETGTDDEYEHDANNNIVSVKAAKLSAKPTTFMVQTATNLYVWILTFKQKPKKYLYNFKPAAAQEVVATTNIPPKENATKTTTPSVTASSGTKTIPTTTSSNVSTRAVTSMPTGLPETIKKRISSGIRDSDIKDEKLQSKFNWVLNEPKISYRDLADIEANIFFTVFDIYIDTEFIYFKFNVANASSIAYDIDLLSFEVKHGKGLRARESKNQMILASTNHESVKTVFPDSNETIIYTIPLYAFEEGDKLNVKISELGGRRSLEFLVPAKTFTNAKTIPL